MGAWNPKEAHTSSMRILANASEKIRTFNKNPLDNNPQDYHSVLLARRGNISLADINGLVNSQHLLLVDRALRGYFMMNRGNRMGTQEQFVIRLGSILSSAKVRRILAGLRNVTILFTDLEHYRASSEEFYEALSSPQHGLSVDRTYFCVGATKVMHMLFPELFVMLDRLVGGLVGYNWGTVSNSYSAGTVTGWLYIGGLVGINYGTVSNSFWDTETSGQATSDGGMGKTTAEMQDITTFSGGAWDIVTVGGPGQRNPAYIWNIVDDETYPFLSWQSI